MMTISELEEAYEQARERLLRGELDDEEFKADVEKLRYEDEQGRQWKIGWYTGKWYRHDHGQWIQDRPVERQAGAEPAVVMAGTGMNGEIEGGRRSSRPVWLAAGIVFLLLVASAILILGWLGGGEPGGQVAAELGSPSPTAGLAETAASPAASRASTAAPTATPTPRGTEISGPAATDTATPSPAPSRTARPRATATGTSSPGAVEGPTLAPTRTQPPAATGAATATATETAPPPTAAPPALSGQIFFPVYDPNPDRRTMDIYAVRLPSGQPQIVVGQASQPALSRDGKRLAFRSWDKAQRGILVHEMVDGHIWTWVSYSEAARPSWGPDNQAIVFASQQESDRNWRLYRTLGLEIDRVRRHGGDIYGRVPAWLADGRIVYWECPEDKCGLYLMQGDGTSPVRLTMAEHDLAPSASPDGSRVAFMSNRDGNWEVYVVDIARPEGPQGQGLVRITRDSARDGLPTWSPDGRWLAFVSDRDGAWAVWVARPDGSGQRKLFNLGGPLEGQIAAVTDADQHGWTWESMAWGP
ncbi:MAG: hypothetical protein PHY79_10315 [Anaerolineae bacterium]|nr:hypothetical protein [Anaerolineae bacterium]